MKVVQDPLVNWISGNWVSSPAKGAQTFSFLRIPFDYAVSFRPGTRFGPDGIIAALNGLSLYCTDKRVSLDDVRLLDCGEADIVHSFEESYANIEEAVVQIPEGTRPVFLGGDHSISDPVIRGLRRRNPGKKFGIIVFDAHFDSREPTKGKEHSGHWMKTLENAIDYSVVAQLGINAPIYSAHYMRDAESKGVMVRTPYEIRRHGWRQTIEEVIAHTTKGVDGVYLSIDIDCLDAAFAPGTSVTNASGLFPHEVIDAVFEISREAEIVGFDITEVSPPLDRLDNTSQVAAHMILNHMAGVVARGR